MRTDFHFLPLRSLADKATSGEGVAGLEKVSTAFAVVIQPLYQSGYLEIRE